MIEKFNFYDIYGYFLPGVALLGILCTPFALEGEWQLKGDWSSAFLAIVLAALAYFLGHFVQTFGASALKSRVAPNDRFPSDAALDKGKFPDSLRTEIAEITTGRFGLDLGLDKAPSKETDAVRNHAFFLARSALVKDESNSYAEQYQGMYALTRGMMITFFWAAPYWLGWSLSYHRDHCLVVAAVLVLAVAMVSLLSVTAWIVGQGGWPAGQRWSLFALAPLALLATGYVLALKYQASLGHSTMLAFLTLAALIASLRFYNAYRVFAEHFAIAVWRDFLAFTAFRTNEESKSK